MIKPRDYLNHYTEKNDTRIPKVPIQKFIKDKKTNIFIIKTQRKHNYLQPKAS